MLDGQAGYASPLQGELAGFDSQVQHSRKGDIMAKAWLQENTLDDLQDLLRLIDNERAQLLRAKREETLDERDVESERISFDIRQIVAMAIEDIRQIESEGYEEEPDPPDADPNLPEDLDPDEVVDSNTIGPMV